MTIFFISSSILINFFFPKVKLQTISEREAAKAPTTALAPPPPGIGEADDKTSIYLSMLNSLVFIIKTPSCNLFQLYSLIYLFTL